MTISRTSVEGSEGYMIRSTDEGEMKALESLDSLDVDYETMRVDGGLFVSLTDEMDFQMAALALEPVRDEINGTEPALTGDEADYL